MCRAIGVGNYVLCSFGWLFWVLVSNSSLEVSESTKTVPVAKVKFLDLSYNDFLLIDSVGEKWGWELSALKFLLAVLSFSFQTQVLKRKCSSCKSWGFLI